MSKSHEGPAGKQGMWDSSGLWNDLQGPPRKFLASNSKDSLQLHPSTFFLERLGLVSIEVQRGERVLRTSMGTFIQKYNGQG